MELMCTCIHTLPLQPHWVVAVRLLTLLTLVDLPVLVLWESSVVAITIVTELLTTLAPTPHEVVVQLGRNLTVTTTEDELHSGSIEDGFK
jgi:hypothetical protein